MVLLGNSGLLQIVLKTLIASDWCGCLPYKWHPSKQKLIQKSDTQLKMFKFHLIYSYIYLLITFSQVALYWKKASLLVITHSVMFISISIMCMVSHFVNFCNLPEIISLFNAFLDYEKQEQTENTQPFTKSPGKQLIVKYTLIILCLTGIFPPILYHLDVLRNPCFPMFAGYWFNNQCQLENLGLPLPATWTLAEIQIKLYLILISYYAWSFLLLGFTFHCSIQIVLHGYSLQTYISEFGQILAKNLETNQNIQDRFTAYRQLQILSLEYRNCFSRVMLAIATSGYLVVGTVSLYNTIQFVSGRDTTGSLEYNLIYMWGGVAALLDIIFMNGLLAGVYKASLAVQSCLNANLQLKRSRWFRKWLRSCQVLRVYFGGTNYFDELTPLNLLDFVIDQTVSLLLVKKKN